MDKQLISSKQKQANLINYSGLYTEFKPTQSLRKYINAYWVGCSITKHSEIDVKALKEEIVVPDGCVDLLIGVDKEGNIRRNILVGTMTRPAVVNMQHDNIETFGIRFCPGGLQAFLNENSWVFTDKMELIYTIGQDMLTKFAENVIDIHGIYDKVRFADNYFSLNLKNNISGEDKLQNMLHHIYNSREIIQVKDIALREVISEKQVTRIFKNRVGLSPKLFMKVIRFQRALKLLNVREKTKLVDIALEAGYFDQSHFVRDFYEFTGVNPSEHTKKLKECYK